MGGLARGNHHHYETFLKCLELGARLTAHSIQCPFSFPPLNFYLKKKIIESFWFTLCALPNLGRLLVVTFFESFPTIFPCAPHEKGFYPPHMLRNLLNTQSFRSQEQKKCKKICFSLYLEGDRSQNP